ncbi:hypothetical protein [Catellatospora tritici]|uniref:hypothetical protein n=1 Tax=Catellatospora tritici TaxID=2851566 RepID=UPI001C2D9828|nr:hypothetical protein [Catellatospora tritici]MBV1855908.1 hypothetical protein [Catellatospora tritici]
MTAYEQRSTPELVERRRPPMSAATCATAPRPRREAPLPVRRLGRPADLAAVDVGR